MKKNNRCPMKSGLSSLYYCLLCLLLCPMKSGLSSLYYCLLCLLLCRARSLSFLLKQPDGYLVGKELVILLFECVVGKCFVVFSFPPTVYVGTLNLIASIPDPSFLTLRKLMQLNTKLEPIHVHQVGICYAPLFSHMQHVGFLITRLIYSCHMYNVSD